MKKRDNRLKKNRGGFTLIELIVTVAIIAIFSGVILSFIGTGSNTYRSTSSNAKVQMETQEVVDRMEDLIIDANRSVYYANGTGAAMGSAISDDIDGAASTGNKTFIVCNEYKNSDGKTSRYICDVIDWNKKEQKVYYSQREYDAASSKDDDGVQNADSEDEESGLTALSDEGFSDDSAADDSGSDISATVRNQKQTINQSVLAIGIVDFHADVSKVVSDKIVRFQLSTISGTKEIKTLHSVSLRNGIKVLAPDDAFKKSDATDVGIKILNAPQTMKAGESVMLSWGLTGNGSIDQSSIEWKVTNGDGSFPTQDPTNGTLTAGNSGTITVIVTAVTDDGQLISSAPVTIEIIKELPTVTSFELSTGSILVAAGDGPYDLVSIISGKLIYSDETTTDTKNGLVWSIKSSCTGVSLNGSSLTVTQEAGKDTSNGRVILTATEKDSGTDKTADLEVRIASINLTQPTGTYKVGDAKPNGKYAYTYMEAGAISSESPAETAVSVTAVKEGDQERNYFNDSNTFETGDVGKWKAAISYNLQGKGGFGTVRDGQTFEVINKSVSDGDIFIQDSGLSDPDTVIAGRNYNCAPTINWGFNFKPDVNGFWENSEIIWDLKDNYNGIRIYDKNPVEKTAKIGIDVDAKSGFIICADYYKYTGEDKKSVSLHLHAEREYKVAAGIEMNGISSSNEVYVYKDNDPNAKGYEMQILIDIYDVNGKVTKLPLSSRDSTTKVHWKGNGGYRVKALEDGNWAYFAPTYDVNKEIDISAEMEIVTGIFDPESNYYTNGNYSPNPNFKKTLNVKTLAIPKPNVQLSIMGPDTGSANGYGMYWLQVKINGEIAQKQSVKWSSYNFGFEKNISESNENDKVKVIYTSWAGNVELFAEVEVAGDVYKATKKIQINYN